tara:strand:- start:7012 stop:8529 length:1518 start_codon:yes stop_codon:yes gene_type:complete
MTFYITTPIYYVNDNPHVGHAYTTIACDILSRFNLLNGEDVYFLTGTDEHGQKVEKAANNASTDPQTFVNKISENFKNIIPFLGCNINDFIRTTEKRHINAAQYLWKQLEKNNQIYLSNYEGWYSIRDESYYSETELIKDGDNNLAPTGSPVEWVKEESYFFKLSEWQDKLISHYESNTDLISPKSKYNEVLSFIKGGLKDLSISRTTFKWGIPVPNNKNHVMYVWIDALCNYLTAIGYPNFNDESFKKYWPGIHVVGKDILKFHAVYWPAFLMAAGIEPPKKIFAHGWWTNEGQKISKSTGNIIDPYEIINEYGLDQIRYFLFREVPFGNDGDFSKNAISTRINADLSNNYGNLVQRIATFIVKNCNSKVTISFKLNQEDKKLTDFYELKFNEYKKHMCNFKIDKSIKSIFELLSETNTYVDFQAPWSLKNKDLDRMNTVLFLISTIIIKSSIMLFPIIPNSAEKTLKIFNIDFKKINFKNIDEIIKNDINVNKPEQIFPRIEK